MNSAAPTIPDDVAKLKAALAAERDRRILAEADAASAKAALSAGEALIAHLKLQIKKLKRELFGPRSERPGRCSRKTEKRRRPQAIPRCPR